MLSALCSIFLVWYINLNHIKKILPPNFFRVIFVDFTDSRVCFGCVLRYLVSYGPSCLQHGSSSNAAECNLAHLQILKVPDSPYSSVPPVILMWAKPGSLFLDIAAPSAGAVVYQLVLFVTRKLLETLNHPESLHRYLRTMAMVLMM